MVFKVQKKRSGKQAFSPVISTVIMTGAMIAILSVALVFANNLLWSRVAEGEFDSSKQFMQSIGLQIDDVAWTTGRTETITYASQHGAVVLEPDVLSYNVTVETSENTYEFLNSTGALMFNLPISQYSISDGYWMPIFPSSDESLTLKGTSAPVARVFEVEKVPMTGGNFLRVVVAPSVRVLFSAINSTTNTYYIRMYLPVLSASPYSSFSQSITLAAESVQAYTLNNVESITVSVDFPKGTSDGFDSEFFNFPDDVLPYDDDSEELVIPPIVIPHEADEYDNVVLELYLSEVSVGF
ncbi:MAG: hypothetical protein CW691_03295 [Candidatus Bathyarchaeum sp.]|nr:MAG: hypothetical protein CW691_03295 [Candidatus Bathyarchaeum sp.]